MFNRFSKRFSFPSREPFWTNDAELTAPAVDLTEDDKTYKVTAELPGMDEKDIDVTVSGGALVIKGEKKRRRKRKTRTTISQNVLMAHSGGPFRCPKALTKTRLQPISLRVF